MARFSYLVVALALIVLAGGAAANDKIKIGDPAPTFKDLPGVDGKKHSLADYKDKDLVVVAITCNSCPIAVDYEDRINQFAKKYAGPESKVAFIAVNVNREPADRLNKMVERARERGFAFPYLYDESQKFAKDLGAEYTPEFFVFGKDRKVIYMGAMDNTSKNPTVHYLELAVQAALKGETALQSETIARGCKVKYARARR